MFTKGFNQMLAGTAGGNPAVIAKPITWDAALIDHHMAELNAIFATISGCSGSVSRSGRRSGSRSPPRCCGRSPCGGWARASAAC